MSTRWKGAYAVVVLALAGFLNDADKSVMIAVAPNVQKEFGLSDAQLGFLGSAFGLVLAVGAVGHTNSCGQRVESIHNPEMVPALDGGVAG